jgi:hypothetical protein
MTIRKVSHSVVMWLEKPNLHNRRSMTCGKTTVSEPCLKGRTRTKVLPFRQLFDVLQLP